MKTAVIGCGNMGGAITAGLASGKLTDAGDITVTAGTQATLDKFRKSHGGIRTTLDNREAAANADIIILAVKPWKLPEITEEIKDCVDLKRQILISVVAGRSFDELSSLFGVNKSDMPNIYRVIPNTAISIGKSVTFISSLSGSDGEDRIVRDIFSETGSVFFIPEQMMASGTSLASCGIAFALKYIDASIAGGVRLGFSGKEAGKIVMETMYGALELLKANNSVPQEEIDKVTTPGGLTLKGLQAMEQAGFTEAVIAGLEQSR